MWPSARPQERFLNFSKAPLTQNPGQPRIVASRPPERPSAPLIDPAFGPGRWGGIDGIEASPQQAHNFSPEIIHNAFGGNPRFFGWVEMQLWNEYQNGNRWGGKAKIKQKVEVLKAHFLVPLKLFPTHFPASLKSTTLTRIIREKFLKEERTSANMLLSPNNQLRSKDVL
jgi:hypothetical protein